MEAAAPIAQDNDDEPVPVLPEAEGEPGACVGGNATAEESTAEVVADSACDTVKNVVAAVSSAISTVADVVVPEAAPEMPAATEIEEPIVEAAAEEPKFVANSDAPASEHAPTGVSIDEAGAEGEKDGVASVDSVEVTLDFVTHDESAKATSAVISDQLMAVVDNIVDNIVVVEAAPLVGPAATATTDEVRCIDVMSLGWEHERSSFESATFEIASMPHEPFVPSENPFRDYSMLVFKSTSLSTSGLSPQAVSSTRQPFSGHTHCSTPSS